MDVNDFPIVGPAVNLEQTPAINYRRTLAFINHFVTHTVRFMNKFSGICEEKLSELQEKTQSLEITLSILEAKLASIPGLDQVSTETVTQNKNVSINEDEPVKASQDEQSTDLLHNPKTQDRGNKREDIQNGGDSSDESASSFSDDD